MAFAKARSSHTACFVGAIINARADSLTGVGLLEFLLGVYIVCDLDCRHTYPRARNGRVILLRC